MKQIGVGVRYILPTFVAGVFLFLYIPIAVLIVYSFNKNPLSLQWTGFTTEWYARLFASTEVWEALKNSLFIASFAVILSITLGVLLIFCCKKTFLKNVVMMFYANLGIPEIVLAVGLLSFFVFFSVPLGATTLIACHTVLGLGYVVPIIYTSFEEIDVNILEASQDLGATQYQTFIKVILPMLAPAIMGASLLVFIISLDDFVLSFFCAGPETETLPMYIFSMIRAGTSPVVSALSALLLGASSLMVLIFSSLHLKKSDVIR